MGTIVTIKGANFTHHLQSEIIFDVFSDHIQDLVYASGTLSLSISVPANYEWAATTYAAAATITMPTDAAVEIYAVVVGVQTNGNAIVVYLDNTGNISSFNKSGVLPPIYMTGMAVPGNLAKGNPVTITHTSDRFTISYPGYSQFFLYSDLTSFGKPAIGVLATGSDDNNYLMSV